MTSYQQHLDRRIAEIYRTYYANFGTVPVPESRELADLWGEWEAEEYGLGVVADD